LARSFGACVTAAPVTDTIKRVDAENVVSETPDRGELWRAQTPQTFAYALLLDCYERAMGEGWEVTDDASVVERCGHVVRVNPGRPTNIKITTPEDLCHAEAIIGAQQRGVSDVQAAASILPRVRIGHGYDAHALTEGRKLIIGGVEIPHETGLAGHSDADVLFHAICDALLGAAAGGDIGALFPDDDASLKDIDSAILCQRVTAHIRGLGYGVLNLDATVIAQRPKLAPHIPAMRENIASALGAEVARVSVKATTTEHLGFEGREEGIAAHAVALLSCGVPHVREVAPH
jgi:2-C-methyl-D-erythritol 2,4-cyclodiphosphate synthase